MQVSIRCTWRRAGAPPRLSRHLARILSTFYACKPVKLCHYWDVHVQGTGATSSSSDTAATQAAALPYKVLTLPRPSSNGATLKFSVVDQGTGPSTVLMLHGFPDSAQVWRNQVRYHPIRRPVCVNRGACISLKRI